MDDLEAKINNLKDFKVNKILLSEKHELSNDDYRKLLIDIIMYLNKKKKGLYEFIIPSTYNAMVLIYKSFKIIVYTDGSVFIEESKSAIKNILKKSKINNMDLIDDENNKKN